MQIAISFIIRGDAAHYARVISSIAFREREKNARPSLDRSSLFLQEDSRAASLSALN